MGQTVGSAQAELARLGYPGQLGCMGSLTTGAPRGRVLGTFPAQCTVLATVSLRPRRRAVLSRDSNLKRVGVYPDLITGELPKLEPWGQVSCIGKTPTGRMEETFVTGSNSEPEGQL
jgi:hypothetical protein